MLYLSNKKADHYVRDRNDGLKTSNTSDGSRYLSRGAELGPEEEEAARSKFRQEKQQAGEAAATFSDFLSLPTSW